MTDYTNVEALRSYLNDQSSLDGPELQSAVTAASRRIDTICGRTFTVDTNPTDRLFSPNSWYGCEFIDTDGQRFDLSSVTGLAVHIDTGYDRSYATTLTLGTDFYLLPENGFKYGQPWPFEGIVTLANSGAAFPLAVPGFASTVKVTGKWGWPSIPSDVVEACKILAKGIYRNRENIGGFIGFESGAVRVREDPLALTLLEPFIPMSRMVA